MSQLSLPLGILGFSIIFLLLSVPFQSRLLQWQSFDITQDVNSIHWEDRQDGIWSPMNDDVAKRKRKHKRKHKRKRNGVPIGTTRIMTNTSTTIIGAANGHDEDNHNAKDNENENENVDYQSIIVKWQMPQAAIPILQKIRARKVGFDYNQTSDILSLQHPLKTGGTSFSLILQEIFQERVLPGSGQSTWFEEKQFQQALQQHPPESDRYEGEGYWNNMSALYTHSRLRPPSPGGDHLLEKLRQRVPLLAQKRFRLMTIVRKPIDRAASSYYETICRIGKRSGGRRIKDIEKCPVVNLTDIKLQMMEGQKECLAGRTEQECKWLRTKDKDYFETCGSIDKLIEGSRVHNQHYKSLMGELPEPPSIPGSKTPTLDDVALYTIRDLGGLIDFNDNFKEDFIYFAITERMKESMCLFYYRFKIHPKKERFSLYKPCRPINIWTEKQKLLLEEKETFDYTVWRASNAILDVRMEDMRLEIKEKVDAGVKLDEIPYLDSGCYVDSNLK